MFNSSNCIWTKEVLSSCTHLDRTYKPTVENRGKISFSKLEQLEVTGTTVIYDWTVDAANPLFAYKSPLILGEGPGPSPVFADASLVIYVENPPITGCRLYALRYRREDGELPGSQSLAVDRPASGFDPITPLLAPGTDRYLVAVIAWRDASLVNTEYYVVDDPSISIAEAAVEIAEVQALPRTRLSHLEFNLENYDRASLDFDGDFSLDGLIWKTSSVNFATSIDFPAITALRSSIFENTAQLTAVANSAAFPFECKIEYKNFPEEGVRLFLTPYRNNSLEAVYVKPDALLSANAPAVLVSPGQIVDFIVVYNYDTSLNLFYQPVFYYEQAQFAVNSDPATNTQEFFDTPLTVVLPLENLESYQNPINKIELAIDFTFNLISGVTGTGVKFKLTIGLEETPMLLASDYIILENGYLVVEVSQYFSSLEPISSATFYIESGKNPGSTGNATLFNVGVSYIGNRYPNF